MMGDFYNYGPGYMFGFGWIFMIVFWGLLIWFIAALIKASMDKDHSMHLHNREPEKKDSDQALTILKERYARGEINKEEYEDKKKTLMM